MTKEAQRVAIAKHCGWEVSTTWPQTPTHAVYRKGDELRITKELPDYTVDLNAIHSAEMTLIDDDYTKFHYYLVASRNNECTPRCRCVSATAAQRAKAVLMAIGKWEE